MNGGLSGRWNMLGCAMGALGLDIVYYQDLATVVVVVVVQVYMLFAKCAMCRFSLLCALVVVVSIASVLLLGSCFEEALEDGFQLGSVGGLGIFRFGQLGIKLIL